MAKSKKNKVQENQKEETKVQNEKIENQEVVEEKTEEQKEKLRGAINFFSGDKNNLALSIKQGEKVSKCKPIFATEEILKEFNEIVGEENYIMVEV